jgi:hypothetical protein
VTFERRKILKAEQTDPMQDVLENMVTIICKASDLKEIDIAVRG